MRTAGCEAARVAGRDGPAVGCGAGCEAVSAVEEVANRGLDESDAYSKGVERIEILLLRIQRRLYIYLDGLYSVGDARSSSGALHPGYLDVRLIALLTVSQLLENVHSSLA